MNTILKVKSSSSNEIYNVTFSIGETISIKCNCKAGASKLLCKHKLNLIDGNISALDTNDVELYNEAMLSMDKIRITKLLASSNELDDKIKRLEAERKLLKKQIGINLHDGF